MTSFFRTITARGERVSFRRAWPLGMAIGMSVGALACGLVLWLVYATEPADQAAKMAMVLVPGTIIFAALGVVGFWAVKATTTTLDFARQTIRIGDSRYSFSDLCFVALSRWTRAVRVGNNRANVETYRLHLGIGPAASADVKKLVGRAGNHSSGAPDASEWVREVQQLDDIEFKSLAEVSASDYYDLWRHAHRLSRTAGVPLADLQAPKLWPLDAHHAGSQAVPHRGGASADVATRDFERLDVASSPDKTVITWERLAVNARVLTFVWGVGMFLLLAPLSLWLGTMLALGGIIWFGWQTNGADGTHQLTIDADTLTYKRPAFWARTQTTPRGSIRELRYREGWRTPHDTSILVLSDEQLIALYGDPDTLKELRDVVVAHLPRA